MLPRDLFQLDSIDNLLHDCRPTSTYVGDGYFLIMVPIDCLTVPDMDIFRTNVASTIFYIYSQYYTLKE